MDQDGGFAVEKGQCLLDAATCVEQHVALIADADVEAEIMVGGQVINNLLSEVVYVDNDTFEASGFQAKDNVVQEGAASYWHECFWHRIR